MNINLFLLISLISISYAGMLQKYTFFNQNIKSWKVAQADIEQEIVRDSTATGGLVAVIIIELTIFIFIAGSAFLCCDNKPLKIKRIDHNYENIENVEKIN